MRMQTEITVCTLNCWGIRFISKDRVARMNAIAEELASGKYDFVFLQEVWTTQDYERIKTRTGDVLPYSHYFFSGVIGSGLCIFSRSPIKSTFFHQWAVNGYVHKIQHGDWFGGKGIGMVEVDHRGLKINLYTAHLHAEYDRHQDEYLAHRVTQAFDTAQFIQMTSKGADAVIVGGDLNTEPGDLAYRLIVQTAGLRDAIDYSQRATTPTDMPTCDTPKNSYSSKTTLKENPNGKRLDYILYRGNQNIVELKALSLATPWPDRVPGKNFSYSDHEAVVSVLKIMKASNPTGSSDPMSISSSDVDRRTDTLEEAVNICETSLTNLQTTRHLYYMLVFGLIFVFGTTAHVALTGYFFIVAVVIRILLLMLLLFAIFMSCIWHRMEVHGILAGKLGMLVELGKPIEPAAAVNPERNILDGSGDNLGRLDPAECLP